MSNLTTSKDSQPWKMFLLMQIMKRHTANKVYNGKQEIVKIVRISDNILEGKLRNTKKKKNQLYDPSLTWGGLRGKFDGAFWNSSPYFVLHLSFPIHSKGLNPKIKRFLTFCKSFCLYTAY